MRSTLANRPRDKRGFIIPWFVTEVTDKGDPDFVKIQPARVAEAWGKDLCWICGGKLRNRNAFVIGPLSLVGRVCTEPPMHLDCARYAVQTCPFMVNPRRRRAFVDGLDEQAGVALARNPGVSVIYVTERFKVEFDKGAILYVLGKELFTESWKEGRRATKAEFEESFLGGIPEAEKQGIPVKDPAFVARVEEILRDA